MQKAMITMGRVCAFILALFLSRLAAADEVVVGQPDSHEYKTLNLEKGQTAEITVYLETVGAELNGFRVILVRTTDEIILQSNISGNDGVVKFPNVEPGRYDVELRKEGDKIMDVYVSLGDYNLAVTPQPRDPKAKPGKKDEQQKIAVQKTVSENTMVEEEDKEDAALKSKNKNKGAQQRSKTSDRQSPTKSGEPSN